MKEWVRRLIGLGSPQPLLAPAVRFEFQVVADEFGVRAYTTNFMHVPPAEFAQAIVDASFAAAAERGVVLPSLAAYVKAQYGGNV